MLFGTNNKNRVGLIHLVGIGGIGVSGIAEVLFNMGYDVQGSDMQTNPNTQRLEAKGIKTFIGHDENNILGASCIVVSSAIKPDNPEVVEAKKQKIPVITRTQMLAELMRLKMSIAVSGSHGKTTTTSLIACLFEAAKLDPTVINGGMINNRKTNAYIGTSDYLIAEADESDATFIKVPSTIGVITNIDPEHMDYYKDFDSLVAAFVSFFSNLPFYGFGVACIDHPVVQDIVTKLPDKKIITYGIDSASANIRAINIEQHIDGSIFDVVVEGLSRMRAQKIERISIPIPGRHNVLNSLAAIAIGLELEFDAQTIRTGFGSFQGVSRRFTRLGNYQGIEFIDDYAHHPVEIEATLETAKKTHNSGRIIALFQPHRYSRLQNLFEQFAASFGNADQLFLLDVYAAGEKKIAGFGSKELCQQVNKHGVLAEYASNNDQLYQLIKRTARPGDLVIFMGAGNITNMAHAVADQFSKEG